jgi:hypothetical protein
MKNRLEIAEARIAEAQTKGWPTKTALNEVTSLLNSALDAHSTEHFRLGIPYSCHQLPSFLRKNQHLPQPLKATLRHLSDLTIRAKAIPLVPKSTERKIPTLKDVHGRSPKAAATFEDMGTNPKDWHKVRMKKCFEIREREVFTPCPTCDGNGYEDWRTKAKCSGGCAVSESGTKLWLKWGESRNDPSKVVWQMRKVTSPNYQKYVVKQKLLCEVEWMEPDWLGTPVYASRFARRSGGVTGAKQCELCAKAIPSGWFVAVETQPENGRVKAMYVGTDCAKNFLGLKLTTQEKEVPFQSSNE